MRLPRPVVSAARWLFAIAVPALVLGLTLTMRPLIDQVRSPPFVAAILVVAWVSGFRPALLTIGLSAAALDFFFIPPLGTFTLAPRELVWQALFMAVGAVNSPRVGHPGPRP